MDIKEFDWKTALAQLFAASVNQQTLEEAVELMVSVSASDLDYHKECLFVFDQALREVDTKDGFVISCINKSGYQVSTSQEASDLLHEFCDIYLQEFRRVTRLAT